ncbi:CLUMA_CG001621, isoform A [Clunio marinus]|uniref:CLUMA_CG001621, isoform A n=1 Tax=Clunio marinus TaxID=568069 RepID=A0A1J1HNM6_9DIPT|nr:CLUMA_CG001621, isoform A [Clunio marinus]
MRIRFFHVMLADSQRKEKSTIIHHYSPLKELIKLNFDGSLAFYQAMASDRLESVIKFVAYSFSSSVDDGAERTVITRQYAMLRFRVIERKWISKAHVEIFCLTEMLNVNKLILSTWLHI